MPLVNEPSLTAADIASVDNLYINPYTTTVATAIATSPEFQIVYKEPEITPTKIEKVEKHIDELEEDIEYFNNTLEQQKVGFDDYKQNLDRTTSMTVAHEVKIITLEKEIDVLKGYTNYLEGRLMALEDKLK